MAAQIRRNGIAAGGALALVLMAMCTAASGATPTDTAATHAFLHADYELLKAYVHDVPATAAAESKLVEGIGDECRGVLRGAPRQAEIGSPGTEPKTPRARGERQRTEEQWLRIDIELFRAGDQPIYEVSRPAIEAYVAAVAPLTWSSPDLTRLVQYDAARLRNDEASAPPPVCADMKAWAESGYRVLSPASKAFAAAQATESSDRPPGILSTLLAPYEDPEAHTLLAQIHAEEKRLDRLREADIGDRSHIGRVLGIPESPLQREVEAPVIARAKGPGGVTYVIRREVPGGGILRPSGCRHAVRLETGEETRGGGSSGSAISLCLGKHPDPHPSADCNGNRATIWGAAPASVRMVEVRLRDSRTLRARLFRIGKRDGGPGVLYLLNLGKRQRMTAVIYFDAAGAAVREVHTQPLFASCQPPPGAPTPNPPRFVELAKATAPDGRSFTIQAFLVTVAHHTEFSFMSPLQPGAGSEIEGGNETKAKAFAWSLATECPPHQVALLYGILAAPGGSVLARTPEGLVPLAKLALAAHLHSDGPLVYGAFTTIPEELIVLRADGSTLYTESLAAKAKEETEFCEGYAEPSS